MNKQYDFNIENTRTKNLQNGVNINHNPYINQNISPVHSPLNQNIAQQNSGFISGDFVKGALIGAAVTYLLTNKHAQETIMKAFGKGSQMFQAGIEELKERYEDAKAQMQVQQEQ